MLRLDLQIARLKAKHRRSPWRNQFPDLSTPPSPTSDRITETRRWSKGVIVPGVTISHLHKQGYEVLTKEALKHTGKP